MPAAGTLHHLRITVTDRDRSRRFYDPLLALLGYSFLNEDDDRACYRLDGPDGGPVFFLMSEATEAHRHDRFDLGQVGLHHVAFRADSRSHVDQIYRLVAELGAPHQGPPREYDYAPGYYAVYFRDPDNLKLEAVHVP